MAKFEADNAQLEEPLPMPARPTYDENEFKVEFDSAHPAIQIPPEVKDEVDNDFDLPYTPPTNASE